MRLDPDLPIVESGGRPVMRTRAGLGSGLELVLPGGLWTNVPVTEPFAQRSPYRLRWNGAGFHLEHDALGPVAAVGLSPRPAWYDRATRSGKPMTRVGSLQGTYLGVYPAKVCEFWKRRPKDQCRFCSVGLNLGVDDATDKSVEDVLEVVLAARRESGITYVDFNTGHFEDEGFLDAIEPYIVRVKEATGLLVGVQTPPHHDLARYVELRRMGVNRVSFCFELFDRQRFQEICPGKHQQYGLDRYLEAIEFCAKSVGPVGRGFEPWVVNGEIVAGLEAPERSIEAIDWITSVGAIPTVCVFRPLVGTDLADHPPPNREELVPVFRRLYEACMEAGLPIGVAPGIQVSLVLLPDEARMLTERPRRFWFGELKLRAMRPAFGFGLKREIARADARRQAAAPVERGT